MKGLKRPVMLSVSGKYTEPIFSGDKWWEVRKTAPYLTPPFTVYLYETKSPYISFGLPHRGAGRVVGEFICDSVRRISKWDGFPVPDGTSLTNSQVWDYAADADRLCLWHISEVKRYPVTRSLSDFMTPPSGCSYREGLTRPPQSWCYVLPLEVAP